MEQEIIKLLHADLEYTRYKIKAEPIIFEVYSVYQREMQDIPIQDKQTILLLDTRKMFCGNPERGHKTFSERFDFVSPNG